MVMEKTLRKIFIGIIITLAHKGLPVIGYSVQWAIVHENKDCPLNSDQSFHTETGVLSSTECAHLCTVTPNCVLFQYDNQNQICTFYPMSVPYQTYRNSVPYQNSCVAGSKVSSFRKYKAGCSGPKYVYDYFNGYCIFIGTNQVQGCDTAKAICEARGESLIIIDNLQKLAHVQNIIKSSYALNRLGYIIGGKRINGTFQWMNGDLMPLTLDYWNTNPLSLSSSFECVVIGNNVIFNYKFSAIAPTSWASYFCEKPV